MTQRYISPDGPGPGTRGRRAAGLDTGSRADRRYASRTASRRRRTRRLVLTFGILALVLVLGGAGLYLKLNANISSVALGDKIGKDNERPKESPTGAMNLLLFGSDSRAGTGGQYGATGGARSDTTMLIHVYKGGEKAVVVSIPRDTMLKIPSCTMDNGGTTPVQSKAQFNSALTTGGPACVWKTVESLSGLRLDHFVEIDFNGFKEMTSAVGGVTVCLPYAVKDHDSGLNLPAGNSTVQGEQALAFVRNRHGVGDGSDLGRIQMQQQFMSSLVQKMTSAGTLGDPTKLLPLANAATKAITTDDSIGSVAKLTALAYQLKGLKPANLQFVTLPTGPDPADPNRLVPLTAPSAALWSALQQDQPLTADPAAAQTPAAAPTSTAPAVTPGQVTVKVLNGSGVNGAAKKAGDALKALGYTIVATGTAPAPASTTTISARAADSAKAALLKSALRSAGSVSTTAGPAGPASSTNASYLTLTLGKDFTAVAASTAPTPVDTNVTQQLVTRSGGDDICAKNPVKAANASKR